MGEQRIASNRIGVLPKRFFWQPRGIFPSLSDFAGGPLADVTSRIRSRTNSNHALLVAEVPGGKVIGNTLLAATADDMVLGGLQALTGCDDQQGHWLLRRRRFRFPVRIRGTALLVAANGDNYFHWCFDSLPRWQLLQQAGWNIQRADWVILSHDSPPFQAQMLDILGVPPEKRLCCSKWKILQFDRLIVPSMPLPISGTIPDWAHDFVRTTFLPAGHAVANTRIYISRRGTRRRRLANEGELENRLRQEHQFQICALESLGFKEQVALFASARIVIAPHGAGLSNLVFSPPKGCLIELFHPEHPNQCYERLAGMAGFTYRAIVGRSTSARPRPDDRKSEYTVNLDEVVRALQAAEQALPAPAG